MTSLPLVSVGMPIRNGGASFERALRNILSQDYQNIEVLISDNASEDATSEIASRAIMRDPRVRYIKQEVMISAFENFWVCADEAKGSYFMWAAHDDLRSEDYVSKLITAMSNEQVILSFSDLFVADNFGEPGRYREYSFDNQGLSCTRKLRQQALMQCYHIYGLWRSDALKSISRQKISWWPDLPILMNAAAIGDFAYVPGPRFIYLEVPKTDAERAEYQDGDPGRGKVAYVFELILATFHALLGSVGPYRALLGALFVIEKIIGFALIGARRRLRNLF